MDEGSDKTFLERRGVAIGLVFVVTSVFIYAFSGGPEKNNKDQLCQDGRVAAAMLRALCDHEPVSKEDFCAVFPPNSAEQDLAIQQAAKICGTGLERTRQIVSDAELRIVYGGSLERMKAATQPLTAKVIATSSTSRKI